MINRLFIFICLALASVGQSAPRDESKCFFSSLFPASICSTNSYYSFHVECINCVEEPAKSSFLTAHWTMPLNKLGERRYYLGTFFKVKISFSRFSPPNNRDYSIFWCWWWAGQLVQGGQILQLPWHAIGQHRKSRRKRSTGETYQRIRYNSIMIKLFCSTIVIFVDCFLGEKGFGNEHFWTAGTDQGEEGSFFWMSTGRPVTFTNWNAGEPVPIEMIHFFIFFSPVYSCVTCTWNRSRRSAFDFYKIPDGRPTFFNSL